MAKNIKISIYKRDFVVISCYTTGEQCVSPYIIYNENKPLVHSKDLKGRYKMRKRKCYIDWFCKEIM